MRATLFGGCFAGHGAPSPLLRGEDASRARAMPSSDGKCRPVPDGEGDSVVWKGVGIDSSRPRPLNETSRAMRTAPAALRHRRRPPQREAAAPQ